jgi:hypothetical protein
MRTLLVQSAGVLALVAALIHGVLAETKIFPRLRLVPERLRLLIRLVWQCSTVAWIALAVLLIASPSFGSEVARQWVIAVSVVTFGLAAMGNAWATRGRHFGWVALTVVVGLAATGLSP